MKRISMCAHDIFHNRNKKSCFYLGNITGKIKIARCAIYFSIQILDQ
jgi:hypothetical protein